MSPDVFFYGYFAIGAVVGFLAFATAAGRPEDAGDAYFFGLGVLATSLVWPLVVCVAAIGFLAWVVLP